MSHFNWIILSLFTGLFFGCQAILIKILSEKANRLIILSFLFSITGFLLLPFALNNFEHINLQHFLPAFLISFILNIFAYLFLIQALRISPVSLVMPFVGFTPVFLIISGYLILGESVSAGQGAGIGLIILGGFVLQLPQSEGNRFFRRNFLNTKEQKGIALMLIVAFIWSITASVEKIAVKASSPSFYGASIHLSLGIIFALASLFLNSSKNKIQGKRNVFTGLVFLGLISAALAISQLTAIKLTMVANVIAFKRAGIIVSTLAGFIFFNEKNYVKATLGTLFIISGTVLISFMG